MEFFWIQVGCSTIVILTIQKSDKTDYVQLFEDSFFEKKKKFATDKTEKVEFFPIA
jgi:hypothetical protein